MGSPGIAAWIAHLVFWGLLTYGWGSARLKGRGLTLFLLLWIAGLYGLRSVPYGTALFPSFVAVLDIAMVLVIFKGDVRLT